MHGSEDGPDLLASKAEVEGAKETQLDVEGRRGDGRRGAGRGHGPEEGDAVDLSLEQAREGGGGEEAKLQRRVERHEELLPIRLIVNICRQEIRVSVRGQNRLEKRACSQTDAATLRPSATSCQ